MKKALPFINTLLILGLIVFLLVSGLNNTHKAQVYIDNIEVFNAFKMSKDMNALHTDKINTQAKEVDSLYKLYQLSLESENENRLLQYNLQQENQKLEEFQNYFTANVSEQVWERLNGYIEDFGKENDYEIIFGASGNGNIMYAKEGFDITEQIIKYANSKYEGVE